MALKIGAFLLASCHLISGSLIGFQGSALHYDHPTSIRAVVQHAEPLPSLGIIVKDHFIGDANKPCASNCPPRIRVEAHSDSEQTSDTHHHGHHRHEHHSHDDGHHLDDHISINRKFVDFQKTGDVDRNDPNFAKSHVTIAHVPTISSEATTRHQVASNYNINRSNLPEDRPRYNIRAKKELLEHDNLLKTTVQPVKEVKVELQKFRREKEIRRSPIKYNVVVPGKLQYAAAKRVVVGQLIENATPVVRNYVATGKPEDHDRTEGHSHADGHIHSHGHGHGHGKDDSTDDDTNDYKYYLGLRPGKQHGAEKKDFSREVRVERRVVLAPATQTVTVLQTGLRTHH